MALGLVLALPATASHPEASLPGSNFEIDVDANLKQDDPTPSIDWASVTEIRAVDKATGQTDDSYQGGVKEDTTCPAETTGSIPNNKSDLLSFHVYREAGTGGHPGFLNLAWSRVSDPSGTTLMDFEFNQSSTSCASGPNKIRTAGDLLIEYSIDQGGARADITGRTWNGSAWGSPQDLDAASATCGGNPCAAGTISSSSIPAAESDGLIASGSKAARTFGEAQLDLRLIFQPNKCTSFGSAMLKSRSSDSFTSQLKDFIRPVGINLTNCGRVIIRKQTDPDEDPNTTQFGYTKSFSTDPATSNSFSLTDDGVQTFNNVLFGSGYSVVEDSIPQGWDFVNVNCSASTGVTPSISGATVTFAIDADTDVLDCTYTNRARGTIIVEKITDDGSGSFGFTSGTLTPASFTLTTSAAGAGGKASRTFIDLAPGTYDVAETVPAGWNLVSAACDDGSSPASIGLSGGETVTCTFHDARERGAIKITKTRKHAADGPGDHPHAGVTFTITGGELPAGGVTAVTNANGEACVGNLVLSSFVGDYTVTESVPAGYSASPTSDTVTVTTESICGDGNEAAAGPFHNTPLTNITVTVDSQVDGGTASTITCGPASGSTDSHGDGSLTRSNLPPGTYNCTVVVDP
ncbi:MAG TPA: prealbumin-like fold domain-containing protein [Gaiellaceae bacterium]|nr:prealbumin-like fold domain-containing protein [Gaiellaceae bacterium]